MGYRLLQDVILGWRRWFVSWGDQLDAFRVVWETINPNILGHSSLAGKLFLVSRWFELRDLIALQLADVVVGSPLDVRTVEKRCFGR